MLDLIVRGGSAIDGTGALPRRADIGIMGDRIALIGDLSEVEAARFLDASGLLVTPGFVDIHSHSDFTLLVDPRSRSAVAQGVTTEIVGNCGHGCAPIRDSRLATGNIYGYVPLVELSWTTVAGYLEALEKARPAVNVATLVPHGCLRLATAGLVDRSATREETRAMEGLLRDGIEAGALGYSTGLEYATERASGREELVALCRVMRQSGGYYATHTRDRDLHALEAIEEAIDVARTADVPLQVSHIIPRRTHKEDAWERALELVDVARAAGTDVAFDAHTRLHATTNVSAVLPPEDIGYRGQALAARLQRREVRERIKRYPSLIASWAVGGWDRAYILTCPHHPEWLGKSFTELAGGGDGMDAAIDVLIAEANDPHGPLAYYHCYEEEWLLGTMRHAFCTVGSDATALATDGPLADSVFLGAYTWAAWYLRRVVRETRTLSWPEAIHRLTDLPATRTGLRRRGRLEEGYFADVVVLDPKRVREEGTLEAPNRYATGVVHVVVNGEVALEGGTYQEGRSGRILRRAE